MFSPRCPNHGRVARDSDSPPQFCPVCGSKLVAPPPGRWRRRGMTVLSLTACIALIWYANSCRVKRAARAKVEEAAKNEALAELPQSWVILCRSLEQSSLAKTVGESLIGARPNQRYIEWLEQRITNATMKGFAPLHPRQIDAFLVFFPVATHDRVYTMLREEGLLADAPP